MPVPMCLILCPGKLLFYLTFTGSKYETLKESITRKQVIFNEHKQWPTMIFKFICIISLVLVFTLWDRWHYCANFTDGETIHHLQYPDYDANIIRHTVGMQQVFVDKKLNNELQQSPSGEDKNLERYDSVLPWPFTETLDIFTNNASLLENVLVQIP